jgi:hypothetical protein
MDQNYMKFGIVDADGKLTDLAHAYGMYLIFETRKVNRKDKHMSVDCYCYCSACYIPEDVFRKEYSYEDDSFLTPLGVRWLKAYIKTHEFNPYIYALTKGIDVQDVCIPA